MVKRRLISIFVAVLMVLAMMPATAAPVFAEEETVRFCVGVYDLTNSRSGEGGTYTFGDEDMTHTLDWHTVPAGTKVTLVAVPAEGYRFEGWAYGNVSGEGDEMTIRPEIGDFFISTENSLSVQPFTEYDDGYCAVFREINDSQPDIDFSTLKILPPEERQSDRIVTAGDKINISVKITDNGKVNLARAIFVHSDYQYQIIAQMVNLHKQENDIWTGVFEVNDKTDLGLWNFGYVEVEDNDNARWWPVLYVGKSAGKNDEGSYIWKLRDELAQALEQVDLDDVELYAKGEDTGEAKGYWWLTANPRIWSFSDIKIGEEQSYTLYNENGNKRRVFQNFLDAKVGDIVIGYEANPVKKIVAIGRISQASDGKVIYIEKIEGLSSPIEYLILKGAPELEKMEFFVQPNGSLFKLTKGEYDFIMDIIRDENPLKQPDAVIQKYSKEDFLSKVSRSQDLSLWDFRIKCTHGVGACCLRTSKE